ncbi:MAG: prephenate dehydrogenase [bacterium]
MFKEISIIGLGFMGASIAGALKNRIPGIKIKGYDIIKNNVEHCFSKGIIDGAADIEKGGCSEEDCLIIMCIPPAAIIPFLEKYKNYFQNAPFITDIGSVKGAIMSNAKAKNMKNFIGSHPMCGSDKTGPKNADFTLFNGKKCIVIKEGEDLTDKSRLYKIGKISEFWKSLGMGVIFSTADAHDNITAYTSHLPHLIAFLLSDATLSYVLKEKESFAGISGFIGSGFKDSTRIASSSPELWTDIFLMNGENIIASLEGFIASANTIKGFLETGDRESLNSIIKKITDERKEVGI